MVYKYRRGHAAAWSYIDPCVYSVCGVTYFQFKSLGQLPLLSSALPSRGLIRNQLRDSGSGFNGFRFRSASIVISSTRAVERLYGTACDDYRVIDEGVVRGEPNGMNPLGRGCSEFTPRFPVNFAHLVFIPLSTPLIWVMMQVHSRVPIFPEMTIEPASWSCC